MISGELDLFLTIIEQLFIMLKPEFQLVIEQVLIGKKANRIYKVLLKSFIY